MTELGPSKWGQLFPGCNGDEQSPINIKDEDKSMTKLPFHEYLSMTGDPLHGHLKNTGFAAEFKIDQTQGEVEQ